MCLGQETITHQNSRPINMDNLICHTPSSPLITNISQIRNNLSSRMSAYVTIIVKMTCGMNKSQFTTKSKFLPTLIIAIRGIGSPNQIKMNTNKMTSMNRSIMRTMTLNLVSNIRNHNTSNIKNVHTGSNNKNISSAQVKFQISTSMVQLLAHTSLQYSNLVISLLM